MLSLSVSRIMRWLLRGSIETFVIFCCLQMPMILDVLIVTFTCITREKHNSKFSSGVGKYRC